MKTLNQKSRHFYPNLCPTQNCTGCLACYNICPQNAIKLSADNEGFTYPIIDTDSCIGCLMCEKVCPIIHPLEKNAVPQSAYAAWTKDKIVLKRSSSGGIYTVIANAVLKQGGIVFGAAFNNGFSLQHIAVKSQDDLQLTQGSKYLQSFVGTSFQQTYDALCSGKTVLFSGTPCQIAGLKSFLILKKCNISKLFTIDLVCHGVPSPKIFKAYIEYLEKKHQTKVLSYSFRDKHWSWYRYNSLASFENGKRLRGKWEYDLFMRGFLRDYYLRKSCHYCTFATERRCGDITLSDYWTYYRKRGEKNNRDQGVSLVLPNTRKAMDLFDNLKSEIYAYERYPEEAMKGNQAFHKCFPESPVRDKFWAEFQENGFEGIIRDYLYPEDVDSFFYNIYKYGKTGARLWTIPSRLKQKIHRLFCQIQTRLLRLSTCTIF